MFKAQALETTWPPSMVTDLYFLQDEKQLVWLPYPSMPSLLSKYLQLIVKYLQAKKLFSVFTWILMEPLLMVLMQKSRLKAIFILTPMCNPLIVPIISGRTGNSRPWPERKSSVQFSSIAQLCPTLYDPMDCSTASLPCPSPTPRVHSNSCPLSWQCHPNISSSVVPFSFHLQYFPASGSFPMSQFFT